MSDKEVDDDRCPLDEALTEARAHRDWRLSFGLQSAKMHAIIMKEYYRHVLTAVTDIDDDSFLTEDDIDDNYVATKMQFLQARALKRSAEEAGVEAEATVEAPVVKALDAPAEAKDEANESVSRVSDEDAILDEIVGEMEALNAEATEALLQKGLALTTARMLDDIVTRMKATEQLLQRNARPGSPTEFAQAFDSAYANEIRRLTDGKRTTRSATKMKKSGI